MKVVSKMIGEFLFVCDEYSICIEEDCVDHMQSIANFERGGVDNL
jgi:hypothetical protein